MGKSELAAVAAAIRFRQCLREIIGGLHRLNA
jgi:hypothetical protein